ncbi:pisatin demethylase [Naviculisporaceae sp. PSN 640]
MDSYTGLLHPSTQTLHAYLKHLTSLVTPQAAALIFFFLFIAWYITTSVTSYLPLRHIPGPPLLVHSTLYQAYRSYLGKLPYDTYHATQKYGNIVRVGPRHLITNEPDLIRRMWAVRSDYTRSSWYVAMRLHPDRDNVVSTIDEKLHNDLRAKLAMGYSGKEVDDLEGRVDRNILALVNLLNKKYVKEGKPVEIGRKIQFVTMDILSDIAFSERFGFVEADQDLWQYLSILEGNLHRIMAFSSLPWVVDAMRWKIFRAFIPNEKDLFGMGKVIGMTNRIVAKRYGEDKDVSGDMLSSFIKNGLTQEEANAETMLQVVAGSDTGAGSIRTALYHLITHPRVLERLRQEIDSHDLSWPIVKDTETREMSYLHAIIRENHRFLPPIAGMSLKVSPPAGDTFKGVYIPPNTEVGISWYGLLRRKDLWGDDADEYRPERFLEGASPDVLHEREAVVEMVFGHGRFKCLGRTVAYLEVPKVLVELVRRFDMTFVDPKNPWTFEPFGVNRIRNFWVNLKPRKTT